jgi:flagellar P-ring protein precursor FlgI
MMMRILSPLLFALLALLAALAPAPAAAERIRDLGQFEGLRSNQLTGYGVVVGLQGTGDNNLQYVTEAMRGVSGRLGLQLPPGVSPNCRPLPSQASGSTLPSPLWVRR